AYAPYVSDYSRYLPPENGALAAFWASYWGCSLGSILPMLLGAFVGAIIDTHDLVRGLITAIGPIALPVVIAFTIGIGTASAMSIYCCVLSTITGGQTLAPRWRAGAGARIVLGLLFNGTALAIALWSSEHFVAAYEGFLGLLLCVMGPWTAINLVDYYVLRHGRYDVASFFRADGGIYGFYNGPVLVCFFLGVAIQAPFLVTKSFTGPGARALGGLDLSWIIGIVATGLLYYGVARLLGRDADPVSATPAG
ncbi:MAG TPA: cytosine permease, partial [Sphingomonas sp.]